MSDLERAAERAALTRDVALEPGARRLHGIVHTPPALARFVARSVDEALRELGRTGLSDPDVALIDPACGPGAFLAAARSVASPGRPRVALGLDRDPEAIGQAGAVLGTTGWPLRLAVRDTLASLEVLSAEERAGATLAIFGNPPWAGRSASRGEALSEALLEDFRRDAAGRPLGERKIGVLSDAYVRFWRWASELGRQAEGGAVVALVTNGSFLDGPVHRGMRAALARWFERVDVVDLGGSALVARGAERDENVFGVRPSVAVTVAVRPAGRGAPAGVRYVALRGSRAAKLSALEAAGGVGGLALAGLPAGGPWVPRAAVDPRYASWPALPALMPFHREGLQSNRDPLCVDEDRDALLARLRGFAEGAPAPGQADRASGHYDPERARAALRASELEAEVVRVAYRPLDDRWMVVVPHVCHRPRLELLRAMGHSPLALLTVRKDRGERPWAHFGLTRHPPDNCYLSARSSCRTRAFPTHGPDGAPNVDAARLAAFARGLEHLPTPLELVRYAAAVLAAPSYRARFDEALRADYPRIPPPPSVEAWEAAQRAGRALEHAFLEERGGTEEPFTLGHHVVACGAALAWAVDRAERAIAPLLAG